MANYHVDLTQVTTVAAELEAFDRRLVQHLEALEKRMRSLKVDWSGEASDAQQEAHQEWTKGAARMKHATRTMRKAATTGHSNYTAAGAANLSLWQEEG